MRTTRLLLWATPLLLLAANAKAQDTPEHAPPQESACKKCTLGLSISAPLLSKGWFGFLPGNVECAECVPCTDAAACQTCPIPAGAAAPIACPIGASVACTNGTCEVNCEGCQPCQTHQVARAQPTCEACLVAAPCQAKCADCRTAQVAQVNPACACPPVNGAACNAAGACGENCQCPATAVTVGHAVCPLSAGLEIAASDVCVAPSCSTGADCKCPLGPPLVAEVEVRDVLSVAKANQVKRERKLERQLAEAKQALLRQSHELVLQERIAEIQRQATQRERELERQLTLATAEAKSQAKLAEMYAEQVKLQHHWLAAVSKQNGPAAQPTAHPAIEGLAKENAALRRKLSELEAKLAPRATAQILPHPGYPAVSR